MGTSFRYQRFCLALLLAASASCGKAPPKTDYGSKQIGHASWYGPGFHGKKTASGEAYDMYDMTAAHRTAAFGTQVKVTNMDNGKSTVVRVNDRGPFVRGRIIDLSYAAAKDIDLVQSGTARVKLDFLRKILKKGRFFLQIGSFQDHDNARAFLSQLQSRFTSEPLRIVQKNSLHRVWMGPYETREKAERKSRIARKKGYSSFVVEP